MKTLKKIYILAFILNFSKATFEEEERFHEKKAAEFYHCLKNNPNPEALKKIIDGFSVNVKFTEINEEKNKIIDIKGEDLNKINELISYYQNNKEFFIDISIRRDGHAYYKHFYDWCSLDWLDFEYYNKEENISDERRKEQIFLAKKIYDMVKNEKLEKDFYFENLNENVSDTYIYFNIISPVKNENKSYPAIYKSERYNEDHVIKNANSIILRINERRKEDKSEFPLLRICISEYFKDKKVARNCFYESELESEFKKILKNKEENNINKKIKNFIFDFFI